MDILKAGHHGSKTSSSKGFLEQIQPKVAVISVGKDNRYGHPHQQVLEVMKQLDIAIVRMIRMALYRISIENNGTFQTELP